MFIATGGECRVGLCHVVHSSILYLSTEILFLSGTYEPLRAKKPFARSQRFKCIVYWNDITWHRKVHHFDTGPSVPLSDASSPRNGCMLLLRNGHTTLWRHIIVSATLYLTFYNCEDKKIIDFFFFSTFCTNVCWIQMSTDVIKVNK